MVYIEAMAKRIKAGDPKVAVGYVRVSTDEQSLGPEAQRAAIEKWAQSRGVRVAVVFEDLGVSGGTPAEKRPGLLGALAALRENNAGLLVAAKRDRIARDTVIAAMAEQAAARSGAMLTTADGSSDGAGPEGQLMRGIVDVFAAYERGVIRSRTRAALAVKRGRGERIGGIPYGFEPHDCPHLRRLGPVLKLKRGKRGVPGIGIAGWVTRGKRRAGEARWPVQRRNKFPSPRPLSQRERGEERHGDPWPKPPLSLRERGWG
jgi:DNA invertase Pin-like site-specific DNA recombinase